MEKTTLIGFDIEFNFDEYMAISYVCQSNEYDAICKELGSQFKLFELEQFEGKSSDDGLFPDERLHRCLTLEDSIFSKEKHAQRKSDKDLIIRISRDKMEWWIFEVEDSYGYKHAIVHRSRETRKSSNFKPGEYDAYDVFRFIGTRYAFGKDA
jgi:hypothetical protein